jgi:hypothetical protein
LSVIATEIAASVPATSAAGTTTRKRRLLFIRVAATGSVPRARSWG